MGDQKFLQWVAGLVHSVNPSFNAHMFDDYAAKMAYGIKMTKEDNYAYNIKGLARYFTVDTIDDSIALKPPNTVPAELKPATKDAILGITGAIIVPIPIIAVAVEPNISVTLVNVSIKPVNILIPPLTAEESINVDQKV